MCLLPGTCLAQGGTVPAVAPSSGLHPGWCLGGPCWGFWPQFFFGIFPFAAMSENCKEPGQEEGGWGRAQGWWAALGVVVDLGDPNRAQSCSWPCQMELLGLSARAVAWARRVPGHGAAVQRVPAELGVPGLPKESRAVQPDWAGTRTVPSLNSSSSPIPILILSQPQPYSPLSLSSSPSHPILISIPSPSQLSSPSYPAPDTGCAGLLHAGREGMLGTGAASARSCPATPKHVSRTISSPPTRRSHRCPGPVAGGP